MPNVTQTVLDIADRHRAVPGGLMPALHAVQDALGYVPDEAVPVLAEVFSRSRAEVHGVITYYHHFRRTPPARVALQVCRAESCRACGGEALLTHAERVLHCQRHETRADGAVSVEAVYCLGLCASSPAIQLGDKLHARMTPDKLDRLLAGMTEAA